MRWLSARQAESMREIGQQQPVALVEQLREIMRGDFIVQVDADVGGVLRVQLVEVSSGGGIARNRVDRLTRSVFLERLELLVDLYEAVEVGRLTGVVLTQMRRLALRRQRPQGLDRLRTGSCTVDLHMGVPMREGRCRRARSGIVVG